MRLEGLEAEVAVAVSVLDVLHESAGAGDLGLTCLRDFSRANWQVWLVGDLDVAGHMRNRRKEKNPFFLLHYENIVFSERVCHKIPVQMLDLFKINCGKILFQKKVVNIVKYILWSLLKLLCVFTYVVCGH